MEFAAGTDSLFISKMGSVSWLPTSPSRACRFLILRFTRAFGGSKGSPFRFPNGSERDRRWGNFFLRFWRFGNRQSRGTEIVRVEHDGVGLIVRLAEARCR